MGSLDFDNLNKATCQTAGQGLKSKQDNKSGTDDNNKHNKTSEH